MTTALSSAPLRIDHLSKHFGRRRSRVTALDDVSLEFPAGSFTAVLGTSGSAVASRQVYDAQIQRSDAQQSFGDLLILGVIAALAAVTLVNTLAVATFERRRSVRLLARTGATARQVAGMFGWHALFVTVTGIGAGALMAAGTIMASLRAMAERRG